MMKEKRQKLLTCQQANGCTLSCEINLDRLFETAEEREKFNSKWKGFIASDPANPAVYLNHDEISAGKTSLLKYQSEQLIPTKKDKRPPLLLVLGNPASHSVKAGMFFSFEGAGKEHRFWSRILKLAGVLDLAFDPGQAVAELNRQRRDALFNLDYDSPFRIGLAVIISMPSAPGGPWGGIAGARKLIGAKAMGRLEEAETERVLECVRKFVTPGGAVVTFQKNAWENLRSESDPPYDVKLARDAKLKGRLKGNSEIPIFCVPPTRLSGPCSRVLQKVLNL